MAREAPDRIRDLLSFGVPFDRDLEGRLTVGREAAHSARRIVRVRGDQAGRAIMEALVAAVRATPRIRVLEGYVAEDLITADGRVVGVMARDRAGRLTHIAARAVVLATGGLGHLFAVTTNPVEARGDGLAIAARAGAMIADPEFVQFHPTAIDIGRDPAPLATEALRGEGARWSIPPASASCSTSMPRRSSRRATSWRARMFAEMQAGRGAFLDSREAMGAFRRAISPASTAIASKPASTRRAADPGRAGRALPHGRRRTDANGRTSLAGCGRRRGRLDRRAWRQPSRLQLAAGSRGLCGRIADDIGGLPLPDTRRALPRRRRAERSSMTRCANRRCAT